MSYHYSKKLDIPFEQAIEKTTAALKDEGFGILTEIDVTSTLKEKLDIDFRKYRILGACNPSQAYKALQSEEKIGLMLPCNVIVQEHAPGEVEVSAVDPVVSMQAIENKNLESVAKEVRAILKKTIENL